MNETAPQFQCPGEAHPISRAVHIGRLAQFYPACRTCPHRDETGALSKATVKRLVETRHRAATRALFNAEGMAGYELNQIDRRTVRQAGLALGTVLREDDPAPSAVIAADGRPLTAELLAAVAEGLQMAGCDVVEIGAATSPCLVVAMAETAATGGLLIGNPLGRSRTLGLKFWRNGQPLSQGAGLESINRLYDGPLERPVRESGRVRRHLAEDSYLADMQTAFHALRPLRVQLSGGSAPWQRYLRKLTSSVACQFVPAGHADTGAQFHLGIELADDGEVCRIRDERQRAIPGERTLLALAGMLPATAEGRAVVVERETPANIRQAIEATGARVVDSSPSRAAMHLAMQTHKAALGGGPSGRFWFLAGRPVPDALRALSLLLVLLSASDRPLSEVVATDIFARSR